MRLARRAVAAATACAVAAGIGIRNTSLIPVNADSPSPSPTGKTKPTPSTSSELQRYLDEMCESKFSELCQQGATAFCISGLAVARRGRGGWQQTNLRWRCYDDSFLGTDRQDVQCVDDCGVLFECTGSIDPNTSNHTTIAELETAVVEKASEFCSPQQKLLNDYCKNFRQGWVARYGVMTDENRQWGCFDTKHIKYNLRSECADNCGRPRSCPGGRAGPGRANLVENLDYASIPEAQSIMSSSDPPCEKDLMCLATTRNPPRCVSLADADAVLKEQKYEEQKDEEMVEKQDKEKEAALSGGTIPPPQDKRPPYPHFQIPSTEELGQTDLNEEDVTSLQGLFNMKCAREFRWLCESEDIAEFCANEAVVARKDYGVYDGFERPIWRCMYERSMEGGVASLCVDDCGELYPCEGGIFPEKVVHAQWESLEIIAKTRKADFCKGAEVVGSVDAVRGSEAVIGSEA